jgi:polar amino acid transport system substrate-binding protein
MRTRPWSTPLRLLLVVTLAGCVSRSEDAPNAGGTTTDSTSSDPGHDKLSQILDRGTLIMSTDIDYAPQSFAVAGATRAPDTNCADSQLTGPEVSGFDVETGKAVAAALGVEPCFVAPQWVEITGGSWGDRWDLAYGSGAIDAERSRYLYVTQPYYIMPAYAFVHKDATFSAPEDLSGQRLGACASCTHESYLDGTLALPGFEGDFRIVDAEVVGYTVEGPGLDDVASGDIDAFVCSEQVGEFAIGSGMPLRRIGEPLFYEYATGWADKGSELDPRSFVRRVSDIVRDLHEDGTLRKLSIEFFGWDYATEAGAFDLSAVDEELDG